MAITVASNGVVTLNNTAPTTVSTQDLINDTSVFTPTQNTLDATNRVVSIAGLVIQNGATLIADDEEGTLVIEGTTSVVAGGTLNIGRLTDDFEGTGVGKQTDGLAIKFGGTWTNAGTTNWYAGASWQGTDAHQFNNGSNTNFFGGSWLVGDASITSGTSRFRINSGSTQTFNGNIAGTPDQGIFTIRGRSRMDIFAGSTQNFQNNGGFTADYTPAAAFQVVQGSDLFEFFGIGSRGLPNNFVCDAFGDAQLKIRNPGTAGARYNITHQGSSLANSWSFLTQDYNPIALDSSNMALQNAFMYTIDNVGTAGGTDQADRRVAGPATMDWNGSNNTDPVFGGSPDGRYNGQIVYEGLTGADGRVINSTNNRVTGAADATGRGHEIVTRLLIGGASPGGVFTDNSPTQGDVATNYRWSTDNNDTARIRWAAYGKLRTETNVNLIGTGAPINNNPVLGDDPVVDAISRSAAQASAAFGGTITSSNDVIAAIEHYQTPQTGTDNASLFRFSATTAEKAWTGFTAGAVVFPNRVLAFTQSGSGISYDGVSDAITVNGVDTAFTEAAVNIDLGSGDFFIDRPVSSYAGMTVTTTGSASLERDGDTADLTLNANTINLTAYTGLFTSGVTLNGGSITGLVASPVVTLGGGTTVTYTDGTALNWANVTLPTTGTVTIRGSNLTIAGVPNSAQGTTVLINQSGDTGTTFVADVVENTVSIDRSVAGFYAIHQNASGVDSQVVAPTPFAVGSEPLTRIFDTTTLGTGDTITVYVKYNSDITSATNAVYQEFTQTFNFNADAMTTHNVLAPAALTNVLVGLAVSPPSGVTFTTSVSSGVVTVTLSGASSAGTPLNNFQSQGLAIQVANDADYFSAWYNDRARVTSPISEFPVTAASWDPSRITFESGDLLTRDISGTMIQLPRTQEGRDWSITSGTSGTLYRNDRTGNAELNFPASLTAALSTVAEAASIGIEGNTSIQQIRRGVGYTVDSVFVNAPNSNGPYSDTGNYGDDL